MRTDEEAEAARILGMVREGYAVPQSVVKWALFITGDLPWHCVDW